MTDDHRRSFFTSYISGKNGRRESVRFNTYVRAACKRLGLGYIAVIGGSPSGKYTYYYLKHARDEAELPEPACRCRGVDGEHRRKRRRALVFRPEASAFG